MSAFTLIADGVGAVVTVLALPVVILAIGIPFAFAIRLALGALGLL